MTWPGATRPGFLSYGRTSVAAMTSSGSVLVTGASRGLGAHIARRVAADGWPVAVNYLPGREDAERVVADITAAGGTAAAFQADITAEDDVSRLVSDVEARLGPVRVLIPNATGPQPVIDAVDVTWQDHLDQLTYFVKSPTLLMQAVLPGMTALGGGRIVQIGSDAFERSLPGMSAYSAAKGAQISLTRTWARAGPVRHHGQRGGARLDPGRARRRRPAAVRPIPGGGAAGRMGTPAEIADVVAFLASDGSRFITGERITVNGGHTID